MDKSIRSNDKVEIKKIAIKGKAIKDILNENFINKLELNFDNYSLINFALIVGDDKPSNLISIGHISSEDYKNNVLTITAENEENLNKFFEIL